MRARVTLRVDLLNPGHFFAACGLFEIVSRCWPEAEAYFDDENFIITASSTGLSSLTFEAVRKVLRGARIEPFKTQGRERGQDEKDSDDASGDDSNAVKRKEKKDRAATLQLVLGTISEPHSTKQIILDWWLDERGVGSMLKTWAGQQDVLKMARAILRASTDLEVGGNWFFQKVVIQKPKGRNGTKKVEPFYFDAARYTDPLRAGFSPDKIEARVKASPSVEFLALVGLQRFRPRALSKAISREEPGNEEEREAGTRERDNRFEYSVWPKPLGVTVAAAVVCGGIEVPGVRRYRFRVKGREGQARYKAFEFATLVLGGRRWNNY